MNKKILSIEPVQASLSVEDVEETPSQRALAQYLQSVNTELDAKTKDAPAKSAALANSQVLRSLTRECRTVDQATAVYRLLDVLTQKTLQTTLSLTAARGRVILAGGGNIGQIGVAGSDDGGRDRVRIFVDLRDGAVAGESADGLRLLRAWPEGAEVPGGRRVRRETQDHQDYEVIYAPGEEHVALRVNVFKTHRQTIQYIAPSEATKLAQAELLFVDEAAAIPLPLTQALLGPYIVVLSSTVTGYEGTGRSLSLKLLNELRKQDAGGGFPPGR